ncbi:facilitated trehalose transporter Tret1-like [Palaemon carinicauda]|uniref:facilitated trehalose transporter Tret1-like n=1 Tax=Palaemon carinicauda TaxID=392227 RepID=UPI0035B5EF85
MAVGFSAGYTSPALASMSSDNSTNFNVTEEEKSWIGSLMPLSALTGSIIGGYFIDALGRKMVILMCGPPFILAYLLMGSAVNIWMIYVGRAIGGFCIGLLTLTLPVYLGETIQPEIRGILGLLPTTFGNGGILICYLVGSYVNWWWLAYVGAIIPVIFTALMCFVPETPRWYISKDRVEDAERSLQWLRGSSADVEFELGAIQENYELARQDSSSFKDILSRQYARPFLLSMGLMLFQQLSGINAVIFYTVDIFEMSGSAISGHLSTIIVGVVNLLSTFVANAVIDKLGRKILLYASSGLMVVSLVSLGSFFYIKSYAENIPVTEEGYAEWQESVKNLAWLPLVSFMVYVIAFSLGWGPIPWLFMGEALPAKIRGPAASLVTALNWSCTFIITKSFPGLLKAIGASSVFFLFTGIMTLGSLYTIFFVPETRGKTLEEIEEELSGRKRRRNRKVSTTSGIYMK